MINEENLNKMYNDILNNQELTTKKLNSHGFNSKDLADLIENGTLERIKRGYYSLKSIDDLYHYGKGLISTKEYDRATTCFEKCYELDPNHLQACLQLFLRALQSKDYCKAFNYFEKFYNGDNDSNFYLYLLSMITEIPELYRQHAKYLRLENIKINSSDKRNDNAYSQNNVRILALNQRFPLAYKRLNEIIKEQGKSTLQDIIVKTLLVQAIEVQNKMKRNIVNLTIGKKYNEIVIYLEKIQEQHNLSVADSFTLSLAKDISEFIRTGIIPEIKVVSTNKLFDAIEGKNFELALSLSKDYITKNNIDSNDNAMYMLLNDITELIKSNKKSESESLISKPIQNANTEVQIPSLHNSTDSTYITTESTFATIISYLMKQDINNAFRILKNYLNKFNMSEYEFLIIDLIKISIIEKDMTFIKPFITLAYITRGTFKFNISRYIQNFYVALVQNKYDEARIYLDIISNANKLGQPCILTDSLKQVLNTTEKTSNYIKK